MAPKTTRSRVRKPVVVSSKAAVKSSRNARNRMTTAHKRKIASCCDQPMDFDLTCGQSDCCVSEETSSDYSDICPEDLFASAVQIGFRPKTCSVRWDISRELTSEIYEDLGVASLSESSCSLDAAPVLEHTPQFVGVAPKLRPRELQPPPAPKAAAKTSSSRTGYQSSVFDSPPMFSGVADDFILFRRNNSEQSRGEDNFSNMADELILQVFKYLPKFTLAKCALVCKRWRAIAYDESLWRRMDLGCRQVNAGVVGNALTRGAIVLRLSRSDIVCPIFVNEFEYQSRLQVLDLSMAVISDVGLERLMRCCKDLRKVSLEKCTLNDNVCKYISKNINLDTLNLALCEGLTDNGLNVIVSNCQKLEALNLAWVGLSYLAFMRILIPKLTRGIRFLNISGCRQTLTDDSMIKLLKNCNQLIDLDISDGNNLTEITIEAIVENLSDLVYLAMSRCYSVAPAAYLQLVECPNLHNLEIFGVLADSGIDAIQDALSTIEVNRRMFSTVARPTTGIYRTSVWGLRVRDV